MMNDGSILPFVFLVAINLLDYLMILSRSQVVTYPLLENLLMMIDGSILPFVFLLDKNLLHCLMTMSRLQMVTYLMLMVEYLFHFL